MGVSLVVGDSLFQLILVSIKAMWQLFSRQNHGVISSDDDEAGQQSSSSSYSYSSFDDR
jgi:hypothetical protein